MTAGRKLHGKTTAADLVGTQALNGGLRSGQALANCNPSQVTLLLFDHIQLISSNIFLPLLLKPSRVCLSSTD